MDQLARISLAQRKLETAETILWEYITDPELKKAFHAVADAGVHIARLKKDLEWHRPNESRKQQKEAKLSDSSKDSAVTVRIDDPTESKHVT